MILLFLFLIVIYILSIFFLFKLKDHTSDSNISRFLPFFVSLPELVFILYYGINNQPYIITLLVVSSNYFNILILFFINIFKNKETNINRKYLYLLLLLLYSYILIISAFDNKQISIFNCNVVNYIVVMIFAIFLFYNDYGKMKLNYNKKSVLPFMLSLVLIVSLFGTLIGFLPYTKILIISFFILPTITIVPKMIGSVTLKKIDYNLSYNLIISGLFYNLLYMVIGDLFIKNDIYFYTVSFVAQKTRISLYLIIMLIISLFYKGKDRIMINIINLIVFIISIVLYIF